MSNNQIIQKRELSTVYNQVHIEPIQKEIVALFVNILHQHTPLEEWTLRGLAIMGIREWQLNNHQLKKNISALTTNERINAVKEMTNSVEILFMKYIRNTEYNSKIKQGILSFLDNYSKSYAQRPAVLIIN